MEFKEWFESWTQHIGTQIPVSLTKAFDTWLSGKKPSYDLFLQFHSEVRKKMMSGELVGEGTTSVSLRKAIAKQAGLSNLDSLVERYYKKALMEFKEPFVYGGPGNIFWTIRRVKT